VLEAHIRERWGAARSFADGEEEEEDDEEEEEEAACEPRSIKGGSKRPREDVAKVTTDGHSVDPDMEEDNDEDEDDGENDDENFTLKKIFPGGRFANADAMQWYMNAVPASGFVPWTSAAVRRLINAAHDYAEDWEKVQRRQFPGYSVQSLKLRHAYEVCRAQDGPFTKAQDKSLREIAKRHRERCWDLISKEFNEAHDTQYTEWACLEQFVRKKAPASFSSLDDEKLTKLVQAFGDGDWQLIAELMQTFTARQCAARYREHLEARQEVAEHRARIPWTSLEDDRLQRCVGAYGENWTLIQKHLPGRSAMQCRERWKNVLDTSLNKSAWTSAEDTLLQQLVAKHGAGKWSKIAKELSAHQQHIGHGARTPTMCRKRMATLAPSAK